MYFKVEKRERSPCSELPDAEVAPAIHMVVSMYIYAVMVSITDLEMAGCELDNSGVTVPVMYPSAPAASYEMDTYSRDNSEEDEPVKGGRVSY